MNNNPILVRITEFPFQKRTFNWRWEEPSKLSLWEKFLRYFGFAYVLKFSINKELPVQLKYSNDHSRLRS